MLLYAWVGTTGSQLSATRMVFKYSEQRASNDAGLAVGTEILEAGESAPLAHISGIRSRNARLHYQLSPSPGTKIHTRDTTERLRHECECTPICMTTMLGNETTSRARVTAMSGVTKVGYAGRSTIFCGASCL